MVHQTSTVVNNFSSQGLLLLHCQTVCDVHGTDMADDMDPGLTQDRNLSEMVTNGHDVNGNGQIMCANVLWNNQYGVLAEEHDGY